MSRTLEEIKDDVFTWSRNTSAKGYTTQVISWRAAMDNYEPVPRVIAHGYAVIYSGTLTERDVAGNVTFQAEHPTAGIYMPCGAHGGISLGQVMRSNGLFDNGQIVKPYYAASWLPENTTGRDGATGPYVLWHEFPLSQGTRPDNGQPIDMSNWMLGPRRTYHFKICLISLTPCNECGASINDGNSSVISAEHAPSCSLHPSAASS